MFQSNTSNPLSNWHYRTMLHQFNGTEAQQWTPCTFWHRPHYATPTQTSQVLDLQQYSNLNNCLLSDFLNQASCTPTSTLGPKHGIYNLLQVAAGQDLNVNIKWSEQLLGGFGNDALLVSQLWNSNHSLVHSWHLQKKWKEILLQLVKTNSIRAETPSGRVRLGVD